MDTGEEKDKALDISTEFARIVNGTEMKSGQVPQI